MASLTASIDIALDYMDRFDQSQGFIGSRPHAPVSVSQWLPADLQLHHIIANHLRIIYLYTQIYLYKKLRELFASLRWDYRHFSKYCTNDKNVYYEQ